MYEVGDIALTTLEASGLEIRVRAQIIEAYNSIGDIPDRFIPPGPFFENELAIEAEYINHQNLKFHWYLVTYLDGPVKGFTYLIVHNRIIGITQLTLPKI